MDKINNMFDGFKWLNFKMLSSVLLLIISTIYALVSENTYGNDIWFCVWALCVVRLVDAVDEVSNDKN